MKYGFVGTKSYARMLNAAVRIKQARPDDANLGTRRQRRQFRQPLGMQNHGVVIQEQENITARGLRRAID